MEKFTVDLDAVLDELEQFEINSSFDISSSSNQLINNRNNFTSRSNNSLNRNDQVPISDTNLYRESPILNAYSSSTKSIDSREAEFSIKLRPPKILAFDNPNYNVQNESSSSDHSISHPPDVASEIDNAEEKCVVQSFEQVLASTSSSSQTSSLSLSSPKTEESVLNKDALMSASSLSSLSSPSKCDSTLKTPLLPDLCLSENDSTPISDNQCLNENISAFTCTNQEKCDELSNNSCSNIENGNDSNSKMSIPIQSDSNNLNSISGTISEPREDKFSNCDKTLDIVQDSLKPSNFGSCKIVQISSSSLSDMIDAPPTNVLSSSFLDASTTSTSFSFKYSKSGQNDIFGKLHNQNKFQTNEACSIDYSYEKAADESDYNDFNDNNKEQITDIRDQNDKTPCQPDLVTDSHGRGVADSSYIHRNDTINVDNLTEQELDTFLSDLKDDDDDVVVDTVVNNENQNKNKDSHDAKEEKEIEIEKEINNEEIVTNKQFDDEGNGDDNEINNNENENFSKQIEIINSINVQTNIYNSQDTPEQKQQQYDNQLIQQSTTNLFESDEDEEYDSELEEIKKLEQELENFKKLEQTSEKEKSLEIDEKKLIKYNQASEQATHVQSVIQVHSSANTIIPEGIIESISETGSSQEKRDEMMFEQRKVCLETDEDSIDELSKSDSILRASSEDQILSNSVSNSEQKQHSSFTREPEDRGGLVQNIAYFERQEMPNGLMEHEQMLGKVKPFWVPDDEAQNCLHCDVKFTLIKRRHHCRSCGKVLCSQCCNYKARLMYLEGKEARVCKLCFEILMRIEAIERHNGRPLEIVAREDPLSDEVSSSIRFPDPNNPSDYCSTASPFDQVASTQQPPTVMVPVGVLKRRSTEPDGSSHFGDNHPVPKQVIFSDGVRPGGDLIEHGASSSRLPDDKTKASRPQLQLKIPNKPSMEGLILKRKGKPHRVVINDKNGQAMPPIMNYHELKAIDPNLELLENYDQLVEFLKADWLPSITFNLAKNLFLSAKLVMKDCCKKKWCWSFASKGLASVGQDEILFVLDCDSYKPEATITEDKLKTESEETKTVIEQNNYFHFPRDVFKLYLKVYDSASKASHFGEMSHIFFPDGLFGKKENAGFVFVLPTMQCFHNLLLPSPPALIALLIQKWEIPWVKVFPLRLILRLGHEYNFYPTPVISDANRKSVYYEIGHTIMNVLADFRNYSYTLFTVKDLLIHMENRKRVKVIIPKASYEQVCKVLSTSNDHVLAFGANFSGKAESHFVCMQHEFDFQGEYQTAVATLPEINEPKITAANFIVFSGALKSTTGVQAKMNVVEDGLLIQIPSQTMEDMRAAIREMKEFKILCCKVSENIGDEWVEIIWVNDELSTNLGVRSQIDGTNLESVQSARIFSSPDFTNERFLIRWTEIFILQINENTRRSEMVNTSKLAESVAQAFCVSMVEFLDQLFEAGFTKIGLRISLDIDKVGYEVGSNGATLPEHFTTSLDDALIPAIMDNVSTTGIESAHVIELVFHILYK